MAEGKSLKIQLLIRQLIDGKPILADIGNNGDKFLIINGFNYVTINTQMIALHQIPLLF
jgi:hypothetical protein